MIESLLAAIKSIAQALLTDAILSAAGRILDQPEVERAITSTGQLLVDVENVEASLRAWCADDCFKVFLQRALAGEPIALQEAATDFIEVGGFHDSSPERETAVAVVEAFFRQIEVHLLTSPAASLIQETRSTLRHQETVAELRRFREDFEAFRQIATPAAVPDSDPSASPAETGLNARVDEARNLITEGKFSAADSILRRIRSEHSGISDALRARVATALGAVLIRMDRIAEAKQEFSDALATDSANAKFLSNYAAAEYLTSNLDQAEDFANRARAVNPEDDAATAILIRVLRATNRHEDIRRLVSDEPWIESKPACLLAFGDFLIDSGDFEHARRIFQKAIEVDPENPDAHWALAWTIAEPIQRQHQKAHPLPWLRRPEVLAELRSARDAMSAAIRLLEGSENSRRLHEALVSRASMSLILAEPEEALQDAERVTGSDRDNGSALKAQAHALLALDRIEDGIRCLESITQPLEGVKLLLAQAYLEVGRHAESAAAARLLWETGDGDRIATAETLMRALASRGEVAEAEEISQELAARFPGEVDALAARATYYEATDQYASARDLFTEAHALAEGDRKALVALQLAELEFKSGRFAEAAQLYESVVDTATDNPPLRRYLIALYNTGSYARALETCSRLREAGAMPSVVFEIESAIREHIGELEAARDLRIRIAEAQGDSGAHHIVHAAALDHRRGHEENAKSLIEGVALSHISEDADALLETASVRRLLDIGGTLPFAYQARRTAFDNPAAHLAYVGHFLESEGTMGEALQPTSVQVDCHVNLQSASDTISITIVDSDKPNVQAGERRPDDPLAQRLLGATIGQRVSIQIARDAETEYEVKEIKSKYVQAFQETLERFPAWFPGQEGLERVPVGEGDISALTARLDAFHETTERLRFYYENRFIGLGTFARLMHCTQVEAWNGIVAEPDMRFVASEGSPQEQEEHQKLLNEAAAVTLDPTAVMMVSALDLWEVILGRFQPVIIPQAVIDDISITLATRYGGRRPETTVWRGRGGYHHREITAEEYDREKKRLEETRRLLVRQAEVRPIAGALALGRARFDELKDLVGTASLASMLLAKDSDTPLYSDDFRGRLMAAELFNVHGVWTQPLLAHLAQSRLIPVEKYHSSISMLVQSGFSFVSLNAENLMWELNRSEMAVTPTVLRLFSQLEGPAVVAESALNNCAQVLIRVWTSDAPFSSKCAIQDLVATVLCEGRVRGVMIDGLRSSVGSRSELSPELKRMIIELLDLWERMQDLRGGRLG